MDTHIREDKENHVAQEVAVFALLEANQIREVNLAK